ncbi:MAG: hypothetical protein AAGF57_15105, partial [Pseudomonadota bacterium]
RNITTAIRRGECRPESKLLVDLAPGAFFWFQKWIAENKCAAIGNIADEVTDMLANGLQA